MHVPGVVFEYTPQQKNTSGTFTVSFVPHKRRATSAARARCRPHTYCIIVLHTRTAQAAGREPTPLTAAGARPASIHWTQLAESIKWVCLRAHMCACVVRQLPKDESRLQLKNSCGRRPCQDAACYPMDKWSCQDPMDKQMSVPAPIVHLSVPAP